MNNDDFFQRVWRFQKLISMSWHRYDILAFFLLQVNEIILVNHVYLSEYWLRCIFNREIFRDKCSGLVHWEDPEGSGGEGGGRGDRDGEYM